MRRPLFVVACTLASVGLSACGDSKKSDVAVPGKTEVAAGTLAGAVSNAPGMTTVAAALKSTGLAGTFDGNAPYTLLAPDDDAFGALGEAGKLLKAPENGAAMAEVLKSHILPGYVTVADIDAALARQKGKPVTMATMDGKAVTFERKGDSVTVTAGDGSSAKIDGKEIAASNGVAIPLDAVLKKLPKT